MTLFPQPASQPYPVQSKPLSPTLLFVLVRVLLRLHCCAH